MKYHVEEDSCIGCGLCAELCPNVFRLKEDGVAEAYEDGDGEAAKNGCPTEAIKED
jgi:ferredoxin